MNRHGQALIESIPFFIVAAGLIGTLVVFSQWFLTHQKLLIAARGGAMLYSSGRLTKSEVQRRLRDYLVSGTVPLDGNRLTIDVGRAQVAGAWIARLDEVHVRYVPSSRLQQFFGSPWEEKCVIKHAPHYWAPFQTVSGPPVAW